MIHVPPGEGASGRAWVGAARSDIPGMQGRERCLRQGGGDGGQGGPGARGVASPSAPRPGWGQNRSSTGRPCVYGDPRRCLHARVHPRAWGRVSRARACATRRTCTRRTGTRWCSLHRARGAEEPRRSRPRHPFVLPCGRHSAPQGHGSCRRVRTPPEPPGHEGPFTPCRLRSSSRPASPPRHADTCPHARRQDAAAGMRRRGARPGLSTLGTPGQAGAGALPAAPGLKIRGLA